MAMTISPVQLDLTMGNILKIKNYIDDSKQLSKNALEATQKLIMKEEGKLRDATLDVDRNSLEFGKIQTVLMEITRLNSTINSRIQGIENLTTKSPQQNLQDTVDNLNKIRTYLIKEGKRLTSKKIEDTFELVRKEFLKFNEYVKSTPVGSPERAQGIALLKEISNTQQQINNHKTMLLKSIQQVPASIPTRYVATPEARMETIRKMDASYFKDDLHRCVNRIRSLQSSYNDPNQRAHARDEIDKFIKEVGNLKAVASLRDNEKDAVAIFQAIEDKTKSIIKPATPKNDVSYTTNVNNTPRLGRK